MMGGGTRPCSDGQREACLLESVACSGSSAPRSSPQRPDRRAVPFGGAAPRAPPRPLPPSAPPRGPAPPPGPPGPPVGPPAPPTAAGGLPAPSAVPSVGVAAAIVAQSPTAAYPAGIILDGLPAARGRPPARAAPFQPLPPGPPALTRELAFALTASLGQLRTAAGIPGVEVAIIFPDGRSWRGHAGFQDYSARIPVKNSTPFPVASVSKTFLAALVVELAQEGRFGLDDSLVALLPGADIDARGKI